MSKKCRAYSRSKLGLEKPDNRKAFYAGWDAAMTARANLEYVIDAYRIKTEFFGLDDNAENHPEAVPLYRQAIEAAHGIGSKT